MFMSRITGQDIYDICEHVVYNIESYVQNYQTSETYLTFSDYVLTRVCVQLQGTYNKYDIQEAFEDSRIQAVVAFYEANEDDEDNETIFH
jgi:hypothetical protein